MNSAVVNQKWLKMMIHRLISFAKWSQKSLYANLLDYWGIVTVLKKFIVSIISSQRFAESGMCICVK